MYNPTLAFSLSLPAFSLNCVILFNQPILAIHPKIQDPSEWAGTKDWLKIILFLQSNPLARKAAVVSLILSFKIFGSCLTVIACRSTTQ